MEQWGVYTMSWLLGPFDDVSVARVVETTGTGELVAEFIPEEIGEWRNVL